MTRLLGKWIPLTCIVAFATSAVAADKIYWSTISDNLIRRANLDGTDAETILTGTGNRFGGIAFDTMQNHLYCGDGTALFMANLDGTNRTNLVTTLGGNAVADVELDLVHGKVYWTESPYSSPRTIRCANLDGSNPTTIKSYSDGLIEGLAIDPTAGKLYYAHAFNFGAVGADRIDVSNLDGSMYTTFKTLAVGSHPFDVEVDTVGGRLYWNEYASGVVANQKIHRTNLDGTGSIEFVLAPPNGATNSMCFDPIDQKGYIIGYNGLSDYTIQRFNADGSGLTNIMQAHTANYLAVYHVPEPGTMVLLTLALSMCGIGWCRRHR